MKSATLKVPGIDSFDASGNVVFGFSGGWPLENSEITPEQPSLYLMTMTAHRLALLAEVSNSLLMDGFDYEQQLSSAMSRAIAWFFDSAFLRGDGAGQPLGILAAPCTITVAKEGNQVGDTILYQNLVKMFASLHPGSVSRSVWLASPSTIPQLSQLVIAIGTSGSHIPVMTAADGGFSILSRPVLFTEKCSALGDVGDIVLADLSQYGIGMRAEVTLDKSNAPGFSRDTTHFRCVLRADGQPLWKSSYQPAHGTALSPFVVLAER